MKTIIFRVFISALIIILAGWLYIFYVDHNNYHIIIYMEGKDAPLACENFEFKDDVFGHSILYECSPGYHEYEKTNNPYLEVTLSDFGDANYFTHKKGLEKVMDNLIQKLEEGKSKYQYQYEIMVKKQPSFGF